MKSGNFKTIDGTDWNMDVVARYTDVDSFIAAYPDAYTNHNPAAKAKRMAIVFDEAKKAVEPADAAKSVESKPAAKPSRN